MKSNWKIEIKTQFNNNNIDSKKKQSYLLKGGKIVL